MGNVALIEKNMVEGLKQIGKIIDSNYSRVRISVLDSIGSVEVESMSEGGPLLQSCLMISVDVYEMTMTSTANEGSGQLLTERCVTAVEKYQGQGGLRDLEEFIDGVLGQWAEHGCTYKTSVFRAGSVTSSQLIHKIIKHLGKQVKGCKAYTMVVESNELGFDNIVLQFVQPREIYVGVEVSYYFNLDTCRLDYTITSNGTVVTGCEKSMEKFLEDMTKPVTDILNINQPRGYLGHHY